MEQTTQGANAVKLPRGMFSGKLDDKGRLKLPSEMQKFVAGLPENKFFVTSLDRKKAIIYPIAVWERNEQFFLNYTADPKVRARVIFNSNDLGSEEEMDGQGRIQFTTKLRRALNIENQQVHLQGVRGSIEVFSEAAYQSQRAEAEQTSETDVDTLLAAGMQ